MAKDSSSFNEKLIRQLANILNETGLTEIEYEKEQCRVKVAKQPGLQHITPAQPSITPLHEPQTTTTKITTEQTDSNIDKAIKSPMVGNVYLAPAPKEANFVQIGSHVKADDTLLIIESMKVMNQN